jgi:hypothetical protein
VEDQVLKNHYKHYQEGQLMKKRIIIRKKKILNINKILYLLLVSNHHSGYSYQ